ERGVRASGELAAATIVDAGAEVARLADHGRARGALDGRFHLGLGRGQRALHDLQQDRVDGHEALASTRLPRRSTPPTSPGNTTVVAPYSSTTAGPRTTSPGSRRARSYTAQSWARPPMRTGRRPVSARSGRPSPRGRSGKRGRAMGPIPVTRRFTHSI